VPLFCFLSPKLFSCVQRKLFFFCHDVHKLRQSRSTRTVNLSSYSRDSRIIIVLQIPGYHLVFAWDKNNLKKPLKRQSFRRITLSNELMTLVVPLSTRPEIIKKMLLSNHFKNTFHFNYSINWINFSDEFSGQPHIID
jgi:hypothetical protein